MAKLLLAVFLALGAVAAQTPASPPPQDNPPGSISGVVKDAEGAPIPEVNIRVVVASKPYETSTDSQGRYELRDVPPGTIRVNALLDRRSEGRFVSKRRIVTLPAGQELTSIDFRLDAKPAEIAGRVLDENGEPVAGVQVHLAATEYQYGSQRHGFRDTATTDDRGEYRLARNIKPGVSYAVLAKPLHWQLPAVSDLPTDPKLRRPARVPTYYPKSASIDGAERLVLQSGEIREGVDIRLLQSPSYCMEGVLTAAGRPGEMYFILEEREATFGTYKDGGMYGRTPSGTTGPDGKMRICDLHAGDYRLTASSPLKAAGEFFFSTTDVSITREDIKNLSISALPLLHLSGEIAWDLIPPDTPVETEIAISLNSLYRALWPPEQKSLYLRAAVPGEFSFPGPLLMDDYHVRVMGLPKNIYVKDITYAGLSVLHSALRLGSARGEARLRVVLAHDAAFVRAKVLDSDGHPVGDARVYLIPGGVGSEPDLAERVLAGQTDQYGVYTSEGLAPGKYFVVASTLELGATPEEIAKLGRALPKAKPVELGPGATADVTIEPMALN